MVATHTAPARKAPSRRTQEVRSAESRLSLLNAAAACLCERGFAGTTVAEIAKRAQLSLGCLQHHFPEKRDLLAAAVEHVFEQHRSQLVSALATLPDTPDRVARALDLLWASIQSDAFIAYLELVVAARTDPTLHAHVERTAQRMSEATKATFKLLYSAPEVATPFADLMPTLVMGVLEGAMLGKIANPKDNEGERVVAALKAIHALATGTAVAGSR